MVEKKISLLSKETIDKIAAGEVVERPVSVVKELVENAIDAGANAISIEIKEGGKSLIYISDNGCGIPKEQLQTAFLRHATSKLRDADELMSVHTLGFRGEALSSICAVSRVEIITKPAAQLMGCRYVMEGAQEVSFDEVGAPDGTTIMVRQLFYNTPARRKFLKSDTTEAGYIVELAEKLALSHPEISFSFLSNNKEKLHTAGNGNLFDAVYQIYGRQVSSQMIPVHRETDELVITGFIGKPALVRGNRTLENFFINGRYIKSDLLSKALETGYAGYLMSHQYPFCVLNIKTKKDTVDVNVHPTKQEVRFHKEKEVFETLQGMVFDAIRQEEDITEITIGAQENEDGADGMQPSPADEVKKQESLHIQPFEKNKLAQMKERITAEIHKDTPYERKYREFYEKKENADFGAGNESDTDDSTAAADDKPSETLTAEDKSSETPKAEDIPTTDYEQTSFLSEKARKSHRIIGQAFDTYWLVEYDKKLYIIDQHAAHEKVLYEKMMKQLAEKTMTSQMVSPPMIISLSSQEEQIWEQYREIFEKIGFSVSAFGGKEYAIDGVPANLFSLDWKQLFLEILNDCAQYPQNRHPDAVLEKVASMACKAAVKGNQTLPRSQAEHLIDELLSLENPYHCPHGRPTIISLTQYELEKKFKRIV